jgi:hypothetical protein
MKNLFCITYHSLSGLFSKPKTASFIFFLLVLLNSAYLLFYRYMPGLDGPQHLYNSNIIIELLRSNEVISQFFKINDVLVGYWTAHAILAFFNWIFPAWIAEKVFIFILLAGVPVSFRYLVRTINPAATYALLLIIPVSQHSFVFMGYYAFSLGWIFFFTTLAYYFKNSKEWNLKKAFPFGALLLLLFLTHMVVYAFTLFIIGLHILYKTFKGSGHRSYLNHLQSQLTGAGIIFFAALPSLVLALRYYVHVLSIVTTNPQPENEPQNLTENLTQLSCLVGFDGVTEGFYNRIFFPLLILLALYSIFNLLKGAVKVKGWIFQEITSVQIFWMTVSLLMIVLYFILPDKHGTGNLLKRILLLFLFVFVTFLAINHFPAYLQVLVSVIVVWYMIGMFQVRSVYYERLDNQIRNLEQISAAMEENHIFVSINAFPVWNNHHFPLYAGAEKLLVSLQNPQCEGQFPIVWNKDQLPPSFAGIYPANRIEIIWRSGRMGKTRVQFIDYIVVQGYRAFRDYPEYRELKIKIEKYYKLSVLSDDKYWALYELIPGEYMNQMMEQFLPL